MVQSPSEQLAGGFDPDTEIATRDAPPASRGTERVPGVEHRNAKVVDGPDRLNGPLSGGRHLRYDNNTGHGSDSRRGRDRDREVLAPSTRQGQP